MSSVLHVVVHTAFGSRLTCAGSYMLGHLFVMGLKGMHLGSFACIALVLGHRAERVLVR